MRLDPRCLLLITPLLTGGCAAYEMAPLVTTHPAHLEAMVSPERPISRTLVYTRSEVPSSQPSAANTVPREDQRGVSPAAAAQQYVEGEGKVVATVPNASQVVVEHGEIKGFMEAMTMGYRVDPPSLLEGLMFGDKVRFTIDVPNKVIIKIEKTK